ncbi:MAG: hypothetical protein ABI867_27680 [Kofleriaceae bacterium]
MIPYDDLVIALATWRAKQGLPVAQLSGSVAAGPPAAAPPAYEPPVRAPTPSPTPRTAPPAPPSRSFAATPPPLAPADTHDDPVEVDETEALIEESHYENEGDDFAMAFNALQVPEHDGESTAIGQPPQVRDPMDSDTEDQPPKGNRGW